MFRFAALTLSAIVCFGPVLAQDDSTRVDAMVTAIRENACQGGGVANARWDGSDTLRVWCCSGDAVPVSLATVEPGPSDPVEYAVRGGICEIGVRDAKWERPNILRVSCCTPLGTTTAASGVAAGEVATNFVPLLGALGPALGLTAGAALLAITSGSSSTSDTQ